MLPYLSELLFAAAINLCELGPFCQAFLELVVISQLKWLCEIDQVAGSQP